MEIVGFDIDLIKAIADEAGLDIEIVNVAWDPLLAGMAQCQYDAAISAMTITEERKEVMLFSNPYFEAGQLVTVRFGNTEIASKEDLGGKTVGAQIGTTGSFEVDKIAGATLKTYDDIGLAMQDLMNGQIDAVIADNPLAMGYANANPDKLKTVGAVFTSEYYGIAVCNTETELLERINEGLAKVKAKGLIDELILEWLAY
jgi:polar amino acid transport system substrate-binding protein